MLSKVIVNGVIVPWALRLSDKFKFDEESGSNVEEDEVSINGQ